MALGVRRPAHVQILLARCSLDGCRGPQQPIRQHLWRVHKIRLKREKPHQEPGPQTKVRHPIAQRHWQGYVKRWGGFSPDRGDGALPGSAHTCWPQYQVQKRVKAVEGDRLDRYAQESCGCEPAWARRVVWDRERVLGHPMCQPELRSEETEGITGVCKARSPVNLSAN